jgi:hypothetical protein
LADPGDEMQQRELAATQAANQARKASNLKTDKRLGKD